MLNYPSFQEGCDAVGKAGISALVKAAALCLKFKMETTDSDSVEMPKINAIRPRLCLEFVLSYFSDHIDLVIDNDQILYEAYVLNSWFDSFQFKEKKKAAPVKGLEVVLKLRKQIFSHQFCITSIHITYTRASKLESGIGACLLGFTSIAMKRLLYPIWSQGNNCGSKWQNGRIWLAPGENLTSVLHGFGTLVPDSALFCSRSGGVFSSMNLFQKRFHNLDN
ncbi:hypothetical protein Tco_0912348 [Tanacetum coccineum]